MVHLDHEPEVEEPIGIMNKDILPLSERGGVGLVGGVWVGQGRAGSAWDIVTRGWGDRTRMYSLLAVMCTVASRR